MRTADDLFIKEHLPGLKEDGSKFDRGRLLMLCGSEGMAGACILAAKAALRTGVGYLTLAIPESIYPIVTTAVPEAVCLLYDPKDEESLRAKLSEACEKADAVCTGCGLGKMRSIVLPILFSVCEKPILLDADALNEAAASKIFPVLSKDVVMTPHEGEMGRLLGCESIVVHEKREESLNAACSRYGSTILLKGAYTLIKKAGEETVMNPHVNPGLGRAGSGDTLSGIISSLMAQGADGFSAAVMGAYLHGEAGEIAKVRYGVRSMLPGDVTESLPEVFNRISG